MNDVFSFHESSIFFFYAQIKNCLIINNEALCDFFFFLNLILYIVLQKRKDINSNSYHSTEE